MRVSVSRLATSSRRLPSARSATSRASHTSSSLPRCCGSGSGGGAGGSAGGFFPNRREIQLIVFRAPRSSHVDLVAVGGDAIAADELHAHVAERLAVEVDGLRGAAAEQRAAALEHDVERRAERRELEPLAFLAGHQRDTAIEAALEAEHEH